MPESQISPVRDPSYENFNFSQLLAQAAQPLATLSAGRLAIAQQQNSRAYETQRETQQADLQQRNRIAEAANLAQLSEAQRLKLQGEQDQLLYAKSGYKPDANLSRAQNVEKATQIQEDKSYEGFKSVSDAAVKAQNELTDLIKKSGTQVTPQFSQIKARILNDPSLDSILTRSSLNPLAGPNGEKVRAAIQNANSITDINKALSDYWNASSDRSLLLGAFQKATTDLSALNQENAVRQLGAQAQSLQSRFNLNNELAQTLIKNAQPDEQARYATYHAQNTDVPVAAPLAVPVPKVNPTANPTTGFQGTPFLAPGQSQDLASVADAPGTPQNQSVAYYTALQERTAHQHAAATVDSALQEAQAQKQDLIQKLQPGATATQYGGSMVNTGYAGFGATAKVPYSNEEKLGFAKQLQQVNKQIESLQKTKQGHLDTINSMVIPQAAPPAPVAPPAQQSPVIDPSTVPVQPVPNTNGATMQDFSQPPQQVQPQVPPPAGAIPPTSQNGQPSNPFAIQAAQQKIYALLGTSDPQKLQQIRQYAQSIGIDQPKSQQLITAAIQGDPNAAMRIRVIAQQAQGSINSTPSLDQSQGFVQVAGFAA